MTMSESKKRANKKWNTENMNKLYDHVHLVLQKGNKDTIKAHATEQGESLNAFINRAIAEAIERDSLNK